MNADGKMSMSYSGKKSLAMATLLLFFFGGFGAHRFYLGSKAVGFVQFFLTVLALCLIDLPVAFPLVAILTVWVLVDACLLSRMVRAYNAALADMTWSD